MNPLLTDYNTPFDTIPFEKIDIEHFTPAFEQAFKEANEQIRLILENPDAANFANTLEKLEEAGDRLSRVSSILFNLNHAETNDALQKLAREIAPRLTAFANDITLNPDLFQKIRKIVADSEAGGLIEEQKMLLDKTYKNFIRSGADLNDKKKAEFRKISTRLSELNVQFGENVLAETNSYSLHLSDEKDLEGLPESIIERAAIEAKQRDKKGWIFTLQFPSYMPFMKYAVKRQLRKQMYMAFCKRGLQNNSHDNQEIVREIVSLRHQMAQVMGFPDYASYVLDNRMAKTVEKVDSFLNKLKEVYFPLAKKEVKELQSFAMKENDSHELMAWDWAYYSEKLKEKKFAISDELTRPYFELSHSVQSVFDLAGTLYGIRFIQRDDIQKYHKDVQAFEVQDENGDFLAILYMDYFPRSGKKPGAWMTEFMEQHLADGKDIRPHVTLVFNFPNATDDKPSLLSYYELRTLLHEFGHALHGIFSQVKYKSLAGTSVYRDFVELPSQIMENWAEQEEWIRSVGKHYKTGAAIDSSLIEKILASKNFHEGNMACRQLSFGYLDMAWHTLSKDFQGDIIAFEKEVTRPMSLLPKVEGIAMSPAFNHIFGGGYAAGYYGYKWAEVLDADAFSKFRKEGIFNSEVARQFRKKILSRGGTKHPMELYVDFMGREPEVEALLVRSGVGLR